LSAAAEVLSAIYETKGFSYGSGLATFTALDAHAGIETRR
jgi:hypothetical protein